MIGVNSQVNSIEDQIAILCQSVLTLNTQISLAASDGAPVESIHAMRKLRDKRETELWQRLTAHSDDKLFLCSSEDGVRYVGEIVDDNVYFNEFEELQTFGGSIPGIPQDDCDGAIGPKEKLMIKPEQTAFPLYPPSEELVDIDHKGLTKREYFAATLMTGMAAAETEELNFGNGYKDMAQAAVIAADELLRALQKDD